MAEYVNMYLMGMPKQNRLNVGELAEVKRKGIGGTQNGASVCWQMTCSSGVISVLE